MIESRIVAVDHVHLEASPEACENLRWFYGELAGLTDLQPDEWQGELLRFKSERIELRIRLTPEPRLEQIAHTATILVDSLDLACEQLLERRIAFDRLSNVAFTDRRISLLDPGGNRVAFKQRWPFGMI
ncbi:MAG: hypothetical protein J5J06_07900 [Phycisphaerae bacterium]|nr:hypothetical protein [Phycisphaerae bacterium]